MRKVVSIIFSLLFLLIISACGNNTYKVTFDSNGGNPIKSQNIKHGSYLDIPETPTKDGSFFRYWYSNNPNKPFDFNTEITRNYNLKSYWSDTEVTITNFNTYSFTNLTTEYDVEDGDLILYFEDDGNVPYVSITDYIDLLDGFIDPDIEFTYTNLDDALEIYYPYYDEVEEKTYDLYATFDAKSNLIQTNDPGFFWGYIYETKTNYGRNIEYLVDDARNEYIDGETVFYNLNPYNLSLAIYDDLVLAPYYIVNQLLAGSSYYNVYFNGDNLYGVYGQISTEGSDYLKLKTSSFANTTIPNDLLIHNYDVLAFNLDHFYGLKEYNKVSSYYNKLAPHKSKMLNGDPKLLTDTLFEFLLKDMDDLHTSFGFSGYFNKTTYSPKLTNLNQLGPNVAAWYNNGLYAVDDAIAAKWDITQTNSWAADSPKRPKYWFVDDHTAVVSFDSFDTADIDETTSFSDDAFFDLFDISNLIPSIDDGNRFFLFNNSTTKDNIGELLVWGLNNDYINTYKNLLIEDDWQLITDSSKTTGYHKNGYYYKKINDEEFMLTLNYDNNYNTFYLGISNNLPESYDKSWTITGDIKSLIYSDSAIYLESILKEIQGDYPEVNKIGLDISFNTGGNIGALYRIVGFLSDESFAVSSHNNESKSYSTSYIQINNYASYDYDWFLLTSLTTFSAANELATIFKQNDLGLILGAKTGGGTASITPILLPDGTFFTMSSNNLNMIRDNEGNYETNEVGITPDVNIPINKLYDNQTILEALK